MAAKLSVHDVDYDEALMHVYIQSSKSATSITNSCESQMIDGLECVSVVSPYEAAKILRETKTASDKSGAGQEDK